MKRSVITEKAPDLSGRTFAPARTHAASAREESGRLTRPGGNGQDKAVGPRHPNTTPAGVLNLNAYLMYTMGKATRRRLSEKLTARGLRLWHLTAMAMMADLGPQPKGTLASRLDMNASDLGRIVNDLVKAGHAECVRRPGDRRHVHVQLTPEGWSALDSLNADVASADDDLLAPLSEAERDQLGSLLRRVYTHIDSAASSVVQEVRV